ncbi:MAG: hypothetical protein FWG73_08245 [Planctomycetaceae bacterium]|nr:hypothetical protein [Planctomycetaceae bacterium]
MIDQRLNINEAREEGEARKVRETARNMKAKGLDNSLITEITGLPLAEAERLG